MAKNHQSVKLLRLGHRQFVLYQKRLGEGLRPEIPKFGRDHWRAKGCTLGRNVGLLIPCRVFRSRSARYRKRFEIEVLEANITV